MPYKNDDIYKEPDLIKRKQNLERELQILEDEEKKTRAYEEWVSKHHREYYREHPCARPYEPKTEADREKYEREKYQEQKVRESGKSTNDKVRYYIYQELKKLDIEIDRRGISRREFEKELEEERERYL